MNRPADSPVQNRTPSDRSFCARRTAKLLFAVLATSVAVNLPLALLNFGVQEAHRAEERREQQEQIDRRIVEFERAVLNGEVDGEATRMLFGLEPKPRGSAEPPTQFALPVPRAATVAGSELTEVCRMAAELLGVPEESMNPDVALSEHDPPMDDLDLVELVLELEDYFEITIQDEELVRAAGADGIDALPSRLSLASVAEIVRKARTQTDR